MKLVLLPLVRCVALPLSRAGDDSKSVSFALLQNYDKGAELDQEALDFQPMRALGSDT